MKLNRIKWLQELRRVEAELRAHKSQMRQSGHMPGCQEYHRLWGLKAEASRLQVLRAWSKDAWHGLNHCWVLTAGKTQRAWAGVQEYQLTDDVYVRYLDVSSYQNGLASLSAIFDGVPGWKEEFLLADSPATAGLQPLLAAS